MSLDDRPEGGSVFWFEVEMGGAQPAEPPQPWPDLRGCSVLIAADSPFQGPFLASRLRAAGAEVLVESDPRRALAELQQGTSINVAIVDCALGELATEALAEAARLAGVPRAFLLFSPFERRAFGQNLASGFDGWLVKPVRAGSLAARLGGASQSAGPERAPAIPDPVPGRRGLRVLLAEDNDINSLVAMNFLGRLGAQVVHAAEGNGALSLALAAMRGHSPAFDIILLDVSMPGLDGLEVARRLRLAESAGGFAPTRIVALTAHAFAEDRAACLMAGIDEVVTKPVDFARLAVALPPRPARQTAS